MGLKHLAVPFYEKVLQMSDESKILEEHDLKREAAYNLSLMYLFDFLYLFYRESFICLFRYNQSGSTHLALEIMRKYVTI